MKSIYQGFVGTTGEWEASNPVLHKGVLGVEVRQDGSRRIKIGDGKSHWNDPKLKHVNTRDIEGLEPALAAALGEAKGYADQEVGKERDAREQGDKNALAVAKSYADLEVGKERDAREQGDKNALAEAKSYADLEVGVEKKDRTQGMERLDAQLSETNEVLAAVHIARLEGAFLSRVIGGKTEVPKALFAPGTAFEPGKTLVNDSHGTVGVHTGDIGSAVIEVETNTTSQLGASETPNMGTVQNHAGLPGTVTEAIELWGRTPSLNDYAQVREDETHNGSRVEWYITGIDQAGNIEWGNPVAINTSDFQEQSTTDMSGKILTGGGTSGTFGTPREIDPAPAQNSSGLVSSGGVWSWFGAALATLKTTAKTAIGAINELFDGKQNRITATGAANLLTAPASAGGQPGIMAISRFLTEASFEGNSPRHPQYAVDPNLNAFVNWLDGGFYQVYGSNLYYGASFPPGALPEGLFLSLGPTSTGAVMQLFADSRDAWVRCANINAGGLKKDQWKKIGGGTNQFVYTLIQGQSINVAMLERGKTLALVNTHLQTNQGIQYMTAHMQVNMSGYLAVFNKGGSENEPSITFSVSQVSDEWYALAATSSDGNSIRVAVTTFF